ncbi:hypothetical protein EJ02DRAFT_514947 [Clathrospora elynae]|uniref:DUF7702 domain-containing protein n=1 Tax=Clathrospora elynae TaxID=706981 RepID=A0A6A5SE45_9PLEO|nr:hypothetical protein EJ02DRAFT_514947 [Clathrospora elynae]
MLTSRDTVSVIELVFYIPAALLSIFLLTKHGFKSSRVWLYTLILCTARIIGAICQFLSHNNPSQGLIEAILIIDSIGISPLLLATSGLLRRFVEGTKMSIFGRPFHILRILTLVGLILAIAGGTSINLQSNAAIQIPTTSRVAIILYIVAYIGIVFIFSISVKYVSVTPKTERRVPVAIVIALPFILVRLVYSACTVFLHNHTFSVLAGNVAVWVVMSVVQEFIVVGIFIVLGFFVDKF